MRANDPATRIAIALPLSGPHKVLGAEIKSAIELAVPELAATLTWHDDQCSSAGGLAAARAIAANAPLAVIGHACPSAAAAAGPIYAAGRIPFLAAGHVPGRATTTPRHGALHFRLQPDDNQGREIGARLAAASNDARIAIARDKTQFATAITTAVVTALVARGRAPALTEFFSGGDKDFGALAQRLNAANITHLALAGFASESGLLVLEVRRLLPDLVIVAADTLSEPAFAQTAGAAAEGVEVALPPGPAVFPNAAPLARQLAANGQTLGRAALASVAAIQIIKTALAQSSSIELAPTLANTTFGTLMGDIAFEANGVARRPSHVFYIWRGGTLRAPTIP